ncbi:MAG: ABC transporter permease [Candidatus Latescibacterota bacterium]|nr:MAG: ABC transporter permease [Candidatus Latescibacterota bacterium]
MRYAICLLALCFATLAVAHELVHTISQDDSVVITLAYPDHGAFSYETYEIFGPDDASPRLTGRTDAYGRVKFLPDRAGRWRIRVFSEDGHGADVTVEIDRKLRPKSTVTAPGGRIGRIAIGVAIIFCVFGAVSFFLRSRTK